MYYTVYADVMLITGMLLNILVLYTAGLFMKVKPKILRVLSASFIGSIINIAGYMFLYDKNAFIQIISYAAVFVLMTLITFDSKNANDRRMIYKSTILSALLIGGLLTILLKKPKSLFPYIVIVISAWLILRLIFNSLKNDKEHAGYLHNVRIYYNEKYYDYIGFMDSGNMLKNPYTGTGVIIADKSVIKELLPPCFDNFIKTYLKSGYINYQELIKINSPHSIMPITYSCINSKSETMPAVICEKIIIDNGVRELFKIPICFSRMAFGGRYSMLLSSDLV